jgi:Zn-dependent protease with chaperone function
MLFLAAGTVLFNSPAHARPMTIRQLAAEEVPLASIAYRIAVANADACETRELMSGLILHDLTLYHRSFRAAVSRAFSVNAGFGVLRVVPGSAGADAGLRVDDEILAVGRFNVQDPTAQRRPRSYQRMANLHATMQAALHDGQIDLLVRRAGELLKVQLRPRQGCGGRLTLMNSSSMNAFSDGMHVIVTTGINSLARSTDEIAFVIAHEMAHNILRHSSESQKRGIFGSSDVMQDEVEADSYAVRLMANAGYEPAGGIAFLRNAQRRLWWNVSLDHPGFGRRIEIVTEAMRATATPPTPPPTPGGAEVTGVPSLVGVPTKDSED